MASHLAVWFGGLSVLIMWAAVLGAVERREKFVFAAGVVAILAGAALVPAALGGAIATVGIVAVLASTVPLLRGSPAES